jgi:transposase
LKPFQPDLHGVAVESTYNWYWLVDGLMEQGYRLHLANPAGLVMYHGLKNADDKHSAFFLAHLLRLGVLPEGYIYPKAERPVRDLLRRRMGLVQKRTAHLLSFQNLMARETGLKLSGNHIKQLQEEDLEDLLQEEHLVLMGQTNRALIQFLNEQIKALERAVLRQVRLKPEYELLRTMPGIGQVLALTIMLETGSITRFPRVGDYTSYCRCVEAKRTSNEKKKGRNNAKNGNRYLAWAFIEGANYAQRYCPPAKSFVQRKMARKNRCVATKALASKLTKAAYFILRDQVEFDVHKLFG